MKKLMFLITIFFGFLAHAQNCSFLPFNVALEDSSSSDTKTNISIPILN